MELRFKIFNQKIKRVDSNFIVSDSKNYLTASFDFSEEWARCAKTVIFERGSDAYEVILNSQGECLVPHEVLKLGSFKVSAFGTRDEMTVITTDCVKLDVAESGLLEGQTPAEPTPDIYAQILGIAEEAERIAQSVRDDADEGLFKGEQGEKGDKGDTGESGTTDYNELENKPDLSVYATTEELELKQDVLVSGQTIKTINGESLLGKGDIEIIGGTGGSKAEWGKIEGTLSNQTDLQTALNDKANANEVYTKIQADNIFATQGNISDMLTQTSANQTYAKKVDLEGKADKSTTLAGYGITDAYTKTQTDNTISSLQTAVDKKADKDSVYTKAETEEKISDYSLPIDTKYGASLSLTVNTSTYVMTVQLKDQNGNNLGTAQTVDLPLESVVVGGSYDNSSKKVKLTLQNGSTVEFSVADLVAGLQSQITESNKLNADLVDDSSSVNKFTTTSEKTTWNNKQNAISDLATIRSGAELGSTAVQPSQLAKVATSGSYDDLSNKPTIPTITSQLTNDSGFLVNLSTNPYSISIEGNAVSAAYCTVIGINASSNTQSNVVIGYGANSSGGQYGVAIGNGSFCSQGGVAIGRQSETRGTNGVAIGISAKATANNAVQIGAYGTNSEANSVYMSTSGSNNWKLLGSDGKIPTERIKIDTIATSGSTNAISSGAVYSLIGDLETALNTINSGV